MTLDSQGPETPQDPRASDAYQPPQEQAPPPGYQPPQEQAPPPGYAPPPPDYEPPPGYAPPPGSAPPPGYQPPPADQWGQQPPPYGQPDSSWGSPPPGGPPPPPPPMWQPPPAYPLAPDAYPVNVSYDREARINRLWGILWLGQLVRSILLIPHFIVMFFLVLIAALQMLVTWIPVLFLGRFPGWGYRWIGGLMAYSVRVQAYYQLLTPTYPPFSLAGEEYPLSIRFDEGVRINRLWGIPILGILVRGILLIPHFIVLMFLALLVGIVTMFMWVPVLFMGRQADLMYTLVGGSTRWSLRVGAYLLLMVDRYPPFSLGEDDPRL